MHHFEREAAVQEEEAEIARLRHWQAEHREGSAEWMVFEKLVVACRARLAALSVK